MVPKFSEDAYLKYNIEDRTLKGKIGSTHIDARAGSGGRAGSKVKGAENILLANNSLATGVGGAGSEGTHIFGPLPRGIYEMINHETRENWIRLNPVGGQDMEGRSGFAIHGQGKNGSHGCIVPTDFNVVLLLCKKIKEHPSPCYLEVVSIGQEIGWQFRTA